MTIDLLSMIKASKIFSSVDKDELKRLLPKFEKIYLKKDKILFRQGDVLDGLYLVISGKLFLKLKSNDSPEIKIIREIKAGEEIGELPALSHEPCTMTAQALENSILIKLPREVYFELFRKYPDVIYETINLITHRANQLVKLLSGEEPPKKYIAIMPANKRVNLETFYQKLNNLIKQTSGVVLIHDNDPDWQNKSVLSEKIKKLAKNNETILYLLTSFKSKLAQVCFEKIDMLYVIGNGEKKANLSNLVLKKLNDKGLTYKIKPELILLHEQEERSPINTWKWLKLADFNLTHHVRIHREKDLQRILRFMRGKAVGVVLGGGGVRGWAHIGALKALEEADIPIDIIGGTSGGAIVAGYYALQESYNDTDAELHKLSIIAQRTLSLRDFTWPAVSFFDGVNFTKQEMAMYGKAKMENLWIPSFCVASNLADNSQLVIKRGYLWMAVRSSTSVPAVYPPVVIRGELHVDGGILNNLPVDVMRNLIGSHATIIAVELTHHDKDKTHYNFPMMMPFWKAVLAKSKLAYKEYKFPNFFDMFVSALLAGAANKQEDNSRLATLLIKPNLTPFSLLSIHKHQESEIVDIGYRAAMDVIEKWQNNQTE